jgi:hypothetical protein
MPKKATPHGATAHVYPLGLLMGQLLQLVGTPTYMSDAEEEIAALPRGSQQNSFRVFAEWLKDNRKSIEMRLDQQDKMLIEIRQETKRTNGRVTDLERDVALSKALADGKDEWDSELQEEHETKSRRWEGRAIALSGFLGGGVVGALGHVIGIW